MATVTQIDLQVPILDLIEATEKTEKEIFRVMTVPHSVGFQETENRATAQYDLTQWTVSTLESKRSDIRDVMERDYYHPSLKIMLRNLQIQQTQENFMSLGSMNPIAGSQYQADLTALQNEPMEEPEFKFKLEFENIVFDTFIERTAAIIGLKQNGFITTDIGLELAGLERFIDRMKIEEENQMLMDMAMMEAEANIAQSQQAGNMTKPRPGQPQSQSQAQRSGGNKPVGPKGNFGGLAGRIALKTPDPNRLGQGSLLKRKMQLLDKLAAKIDSM